MDKKNTQNQLTTTERRVCAQVRPFSELSFRLVSGTFLDAPEIPRPVAVPHPHRSQCKL